MIKFSQLNKEQKQKLLLAALLATTAIYSVLFFGLRPYVNRNRAVAAERDDLKGKVLNAHRVMRAESQMRDQLAGARQAVQTAHHEYVPPRDNPLSWVAQRVYQSAREVGVDIESVVDQDTLPSAWAAQKEDADRACLPYAVRIDAQCGFRELASLIRALENSNPYLCITEIAITAQESDPERHRVNLNVEWPSWRDPARAEALAAAKEIPHG